LKPWTVWEWRRERASKRKVQVEGGGKKMTGTADTENEVSLIRYESERAMREERE